MRLPPPKPFPGDFDDDMEMTMGNGVNLNAPGIPIVGRVRVTRIRNVTVSRTSGMVMMEVDDGSGQGAVQVQVTPFEVGQLLEALAKAVQVLTAVEPVAAGPGVG